MSSMTCIIFPWLNVTWNPKKPVSQYPSGLCFRLKTPKLKPQEPRCPSPDFPNWAPQRRPGSAREIGQRSQWAFLLANVGRDRWFLLDLLFENKRKQQKKWPVDLISWPDFQKYMAVGQKRVPFKTQVGQKDIPKIPGFWSSLGFSRINLPKPMGTKIRLVTR